MDSDGETTKAAVVISTQPVEMGGGAWLCVRGCGWLWLTRVADAWLTVRGAALEPRHHLPRNYVQLPSIDSSIGVAQSKQTEGPAANMLPRQILLLLLAAVAADAASIRPRHVPDPPPAARSWRARIESFLSSSPPAPPPPTYEDPPPVNRALAAYQHDIVLRFNISSPAEARAVAEAVDTLYLDVWSSTRKNVDIRLPKATVELLLDLLPASLQHAHSLLMHNLAEVALEAYPGAREAPAPGPAPLPTAAASGSLFFNNYQPLSVIVPWMKLMQSLFPAHVETLTIGKSFEGRKIMGLKVGVPRPAGGRKRTIIVTGAAHAREWIGVSTVTYLAYTLMTGYARGDRGIDRMVAEFDWIFIPTLNVDG